MQSISFGNAYQPLTQQPASASLPSPEPQFGMAAFRTDKNAGKVSTEQIDAFVKAAKNGGMEVVPLKPDGLQVKAAGSGNAFQMDLGPLAKNDVVGPAMTERASIAARDFVAEANAGEPVTAARVVADLNSDELPNGNAPVVFLAGDEARGVLAARRELGELAASKLATILTEQGAKPSGDNGKIKVD